MSNENIIKYIREATKAGLNNQDIRDKLKQANWSKETIEEAFLEVEAKTKMPVAPVPQPSIPNTHLGTERENIDIPLKLIKPSLTKYIVFAVMVSLMIITFINLNSFGSSSLDLPSLEDLFLTENFLVPFVFIFSIIAPLFINVYFIKKYYLDRVKEGLYKKFALINFFLVVLFITISSIVVSLTCSELECVIISFIPIFGLRYYIILLIISFFVIKYAQNKIFKFIFNLSKKFKQIIIVLFIFSLIYNVLLIADITSCGIFGIHVKYGASNSYCDAKKVSEGENLSICESSYSPPACYYVVARKTQNASICDNIKIKDNQFRRPDLDRDSCLTDVAKLNNDPSLCEKILDEYQGMSCYSDLAEKTKDFSLCEKSKYRIGGYYKGCFNSTVSNNDYFSSSDCGKIPILDIQEKCLEKVKNK
jgi:hypothetical protein